MKARNGNVTLTKPRNTRSRAVIAWHLQKTRKARLAGATVEVLGEGDLQILGEADMPILSR